MVSVVGNEDSVSALVLDLPAVALLRGPKSVGKWTAAEQARRARKIFEPDVMRVRRLGITEARSLRAFALQSSATGLGKAALIDLDGASVEALNALLKPLEEVKTGMHFLLMSSGPVPYTVESRAQVFRFSLLTPAEVSRVLQEQRGMASGQADRLAAKSGGTVKGALEGLISSEDKGLVMNMVRALQEHDEEALEGLAGRWRDQHTDMLVRWAHEAASGRWRLFSEGDDPIPRALPLRVLMGLRRDVRPRLTVRSILLDILRGTK